MEHYIDDNTMVLINVRRNTILIQHVEEYLKNNLERYKKKKGDMASVYFYRFFFFFVSLMKM